MNNKSQKTEKPVIAVHKFSSCDGCQLAFIHLGEPLLALSEMVDIVHFAEAGPVNEHAQVDIAFIEGSVSTTDDVQRLLSIRENSQFIVTIGACATSGGIQALRNMHKTHQWIAEIYADPSVIKSLYRSSAIKEHIKVDFELWGCPINQQQLLLTIRSLLSGVLPGEQQDKVCMECKRQQTVCVMVSKNEACMGPVTRTGCGALCPKAGRECFGCYGPAENSNTHALANRLQGFGLLNDEIARRFLFIHSDSDVFKKEAKHWTDK